MTYRLYGTPASLYTGKVVSYLRKQGIDFVEVSPGSERFLTVILPTVGRWIIPVLETPDGRVIQDGVDIIDYFERGPGHDHVRFPAYPDTPLHLAVSHLFELFGGEGLLRPAMHYRWNFDDQNLDFIRSEFTMNFPRNMTPEQVEATFLKSSGRMRNAGKRFGVTTDTAATIETAFQEWLDLFSAHLADHPYLLGNRPTLGDYGLMAAMWAHLFRDPAPQSLIKRHAPRVGRWVERMSTSTTYSHEYETADSLFADDRIPDTLQDMMRFVADEYLAEITCHVAAANQWLNAHPDLTPGTNGTDNPAARGLSGGGLDDAGLAAFDWRGHQISTAVLPYRFWLLQRLHNALGEADPYDQSRVRKLFKSTGLAGLLDLRTHRPVERRRHLEVWGHLRA